MKRSGWFALIAIISFSLLIRTVPLYDYTLWGLDCGEYIYYTNQWVETGGSYRSIDGWGKAYPFFPGMFIIGGAFSLLSGTDLIHSATFIPVLISALSPLFVFLIVNKLMDDWRPAILSTFFFTTVPPVVYAYSQPRPETLGFFFFAFILTLAVTTFRRNLKALLIMFLVLTSLIITHHMSVYFLLLMTLGGIFTSRLWRSCEWNVDKQRTLLFISFFLLTIVYWIFYAVPFGQRRIEGALGFPSYTIIAVPLLGLLLMDLVVRIRRRYDFKVPVNIHKQSIRSFIVFFIIASLIIVPVIVSMVLGTLPVRDIELGTTILFYLPIMILALFGLSSRKIIKTFNEGLSILGWFVFLILSLTVGTITQSSSLLPMRHLSFLLFVVAIFFGIGITQFQIMINPNNDLKKTAVLSLVIFIMVAAMIPITYPSQERAGGFTEGTEWEDVEAGFWIKGTTERKVATDYRMSTAAFSIGYTNLTRREGHDMYFNPDLNKAVSDLEEHDASYIMWDQEMLKGTITVQGENPSPFDSRLKSSYIENFYQVYLSEECEVYRVR